MAKIPWLYRIKKLFSWSRIRISHAHSRVLAHVVTHEGNILMVSSRIFLPWYWIYLRWSRVYRSFPVVKVFHRSSKISAALFQNHIIHVFIIRRLTWLAVNSKILHEYGLEITTNHWWLHHGCWRWHDFLHLLAAKQKRGPKNCLFSCLHFCALKSR